METRYTVRQAAEITGVKAYVLRYWEDELELRIQRNEMGHRYYTGYDIQVFMNIKELKMRGLQLRAIKDLIPQIQQTVSMKKELKRNLLETAAAADIKEEAKETEPVQDTKNEKILEFQAIMERLIMQEIHYKNEEEERCRSLDLAIRRQQMARREAAAAATVEKKTRRRHKST